MSEHNKATILLVDDRDENRYIICRILDHADFRVIEAGTGQEGLNRVAESPDLILLDVKLPDMLGYEVCRRLKANPATAGIPVLHLSATFITSESKVQALDSGADAYLTQPVEPTVLIATVRSLLRLKNAEAVSRFSARQWQTTFDALSEGIGLLNLEDRVVRCNRAMTELLGRPYSEINGSYCSRLLQDTLGIDGLWNRELPVRQTKEVQTGKKWFSITIDPIFGEEGALNGRILVVAEITDRKLTEEALRAAEKFAATGRLAHSIAHEINNPLSAVMNLLYLLGREAQTPAAKQFLASANQELDRVARITKQTLAFHRDTTDLVDVSLADLLDGVISLYAPQISSQQVRVLRDYRFCGAIKAFPGELRQVFSNLIANALEALPKGGHLTIRTRAVRGWNAHRAEGVRVAIADTGSGIPEADRKQIFEPFFTTKQLGGSGLGLWLSSGIVHKHGGEIRVRTSTRPGNSGSCFCVVLPLVQRGNGNSNSSLETLEPGSWPRKRTA